MEENLVSGVLEYLKDVVCPTLFWHTTGLWNFTLLIDLHLDLQYFQEKLTVSVSCAITS